MHSCVDVHHYIILVFLPFAHPMQDRHRDQVGLETPSKHKQRSGWYLGTAQSPKLMTYCITDSQSRYLTVHPYQMLHTGCSSYRRWYLCLKLSLLHKSTWSSLPKTGTRRSVKLTILVILMPQFLLFFQVSAAILTVSLTTQELLLTPWKRNAIIDKSVDECSVESSDESNSYSIHNDRLKETEIFVAVAQVL